MFPRLWYVILLLSTKYSCYPLSIRELNMSKRQSLASTSSKRDSDASFRASQKRNSSQRPSSARPSSSYSSATTTGKRPSKSSFERKSDDDEDRAAFYKNCRSIYLMVFEDTKEDITSAEELTLCKYEYRCRSRGCAQEAQRGSRGRLNYSGGFSQLLWYFFVPTVVDFVAFLSLIYKFLV